MWKYGSSTRVWSSFRNAWLLHHPSDTNCISFFYYSKVVTQGNSVGPIHARPGPHFDPPPRLPLSPDFASSRSDDVNKIFPNRDVCLTITARITNISLHPLILHMYSSRQYCTLYLDTSFNELFTFPIRPPKNHPYHPQIV